MNLSAAVSGKKEESIFEDLLCEDATYSLLPIINSRFFRLLWQNRLLACGMCVAATVGQENGGDVGRIAILRIQYFTAKSAAKKKKSKKQVEIACELFYQADAVSELLGSYAPDARELFASKEFVSIRPKDILHVVQVTHIRNLRSVALPERSFFYSMWYHPKMRCLSGLPTEFSRVKLGKASSTIVKDIFSFGSGDMVLLHANDDVPGANSTPNSKSNQQNQEGWRFHFRLGRLVAMPCVKGKAMLAVEPWNYISLPPPLSSSSKLREKHRGGIYLVSEEPVLMSPETLATRIPPGKFTLQAAPSSAAAELPIWESIAVDTVGRLWEEYDISLPLCQVDDADDSASRLGRSPWEDERHDSDVPTPVGVGELFSDVSNASPNLRTYYSSFLRQGVTYNIGDVVPLQCVNEAYPWLGIIASIYNQGDVDGLVVDIQWFYHDYHQTLVPTRSKPTNPVGRRMFASLKFLDANYAEAILGRTKIQMQSRAGTRAEIRYHTFWCSGIIHMAEEDGDDGEEFEKSVLVTDDCALWKGDLAPETPVALSPSNFIDHQATIFELYFRPIVWRGVDLIAKAKEGPLFYRSMQRRDLQLTVGDFIQYHAEDRGKHEDIFWIGRIFAIYTLCDDAAGVHVTVQWVLRKGESLQLNSGGRRAEDKRQAIPTTCYSIVCSSSIVGPVNVRHLDDFVSVGSFVRESCHNFWYNSWLDCEQNCVHPSYYAVPTFRHLEAHYVDFPLDYHQFSGDSWIMDRFCTDRMDHNPLYSPASKKFALMWNKFVWDASVKSDTEVRDAVFVFCHDNAAVLRSGALRDALTSHLFRLYSFGILSCANVCWLLALIDGTAGGV
jgi:hypothetical protein